MGILWAIGAFFLVLSPIIIVHELGHFWVARRFGIKIDEFGLGFPPRALTLFEQGGTIFTLNWIPLGGFVRPSGEDDPDIPGGLAAASKTARLCTLAAGAVFNFILAFFIIWGANLLGPPEFDTSVVAIRSVFEGGEGARAGLMEGDVLVAIDGVTIGDEYSAVQEVVWSNEGNPLQLEILRDGAPLTLSVTPQSAEDPADPDRAGTLAVGLGRLDTGRRASMGFFEAATGSVSSIWEYLKLTVSVPSMLIEGTISAEEARPLSPVAISQLLGNQAQSASNSGDWYGMLLIAGIINVALGFTNLLPLPALDGGRILFVLIEAVRGRRIAPEKEGMVHVVGMLLLLSLMVMLMVNDIVNPIF